MRKMMTYFASAIVVLGIGVAPSSAANFKPKGSDKNPLAFFQGKPVKEGTATGWHGGFKGRSGLNNPFSGMKTGAADSRSGYDKATNNRNGATKDPLSH